MADMFGLDASDDSNAAATAPSEDADETPPVFLRALVPAQAGWFAAYANLDSVDVPQLVKLISKGPPWLGDVATFIQSTQFVPIACYALVDDGLQTQAVRPMAATLTGDIVDVDDLDGYGEFVALIPPVVPGIEWPEWSQQQLLVGFIRQTMG